MAKYEDLSAIYKDHTEKSKDKNQSLIQEIEEKNSELDKLKNLTKEKLEKFASVAMSYEQISHKMIRLESELAEKNEEIRDLKKQAGEVIEIFQIDSNLLERKIAR